MKPFSPHATGTHTEQVFTTHAHMYAHACTHMHAQGQSPPPEHSSWVSPGQQAPPLGLLECVTVSVTYTRQ